MPANSIFSGPITSIFNAKHFDENLFTWQCEKEDKNAYRFQISHFYGAFSNHIMAGKGLKLSTIKMEKHIEVQDTKIGTRPCHSVNNFAPKRWHETHTGTPTSICITVLDSTSGTVQVTLQHVYIWNRHITLPINLVPNKLLTYRFTPLAICKAKA